MGKICILFLGFTIATASFAIAAFVHDPLNYVQNAATAVKSSIIAANTSVQIANQIRELQYEAAAFKNYDGNATQWSNISPLLVKLGQQVNQGQAIGYNMQNLSQSFQTRFPGYKSQQNYPAAYQSWSQTSLDTLRSTLEAAGMQANNFTHEQANMEQLKVLSQSASGRMQAAQVGNMIASEQVGQLQQLRQLVVNQTNSQNMYMAYQVQKDQAQQAASDQLLSKPTDFPTYGSGHGFGRTHTS